MAFVFYKLFVFTEISDFCQILSDCWSHGVAIVPTLEVEVPEGLELSRRGPYLPPGGFSPFCRVPCRVS